MAILKGEQTVLFVCRLTGIPPELFIVVQVKDGVFAPVYITKPPLCNFEQVSPGVQGSNNLTICAELALATFDRLTNVDSHPSGS